MNCVQKLFGYCLEKATQLMLQVHHEGKAVVSSGEREKAELDVSRLHAHGLWATMQQAESAMPIDHAKLPVADLDASRAFYLAALAPLGYKLVWDQESTLGFGIGDGGDADEPFALERGEARNVRTHVAFTATSPEQVDPFYAAAIAAGGRDNGAPGERPYGRCYYAAFVVDPDGHDVEAVCHRRPG